MRLAILSNINMNGLIRLLKKDLDVYDSEGYGNELGNLLNHQSSLYAFEPDIILLIEDLMELLGHEFCEEEAGHCIRQWFADLDNSIQTNYIYYISDAYLWGEELSVLVDQDIKLRLEAVWQQNLDVLLCKYSNVRIFPYRRCVERIGESAAFLRKTWYMGKILHSPMMLQELRTVVIQKLELEQRIPKKVLLLDLDNTLWGGLAGEADITPIVLSEDHAGLAYKNLQRVILQMKKQGVILGIVSKNNEDDVCKILSDHPHMVLRDRDFVIKKINWRSKNENIQDISKELNLGLDSFVFWDDNVTERQEIKELLPMVMVPDFPEQPELLPDYMISIWNRYFDRASVTVEDMKKTEQYAGNLKREELKRNTRSFEDYLRNLQIVMIRKKIQDNIERITQLVNKTNQFNLTTRRYTQKEIQDMIDSDEKKFFLYQIKDRFGDNGIVAVVIVDIVDDIPVIQDFVMSCRIMGKYIENAIIDDVETYFLNHGASGIIGKYRETSKNKPMSTLYSNWGYEKQNVLDGYEGYYLSLKSKTAREYYVEWEGDQYE